MAAPMVPVCGRSYLRLLQCICRLQRRTLTYSRSLAWMKKWNRCQTPYNQRACYSSVSNGQQLILGIETSCDDTGAAVVDDTGRVLGEAINSQTRIHVELGGIIPPVARDLHNEHIQQVTQDAMDRAGVSLADLSAIAATVKPGLALSLYVGLNHAKQLVRESGKPFIPIHHMEAHALMARMGNRVDFPFLVLLVSGGHCLLAVARGVDDFLVLGKGLDDAPGDAFDKTARRLKVKNLPQCAGLSGGQAIELLASQGNPQAYEHTRIMSQHANCNFSFAGIKSWIVRVIQQEEATHDVKGGGILPNVEDVCASFQYVVTHHLAKRLQRGLLFCELKGLLPQNNKTLVVSGGVASNMFIRHGLERMCDQYDCRVVCPPPHLCTDNGIMVAWNGMEKWKLGLGVAADPEAIDLQTKCPLGEDITKEVENSAIKLKRVKIIP